MILEIKFNFFEKSVMFKVRFEETRRIGGMNVEKGKW